MWTMRTIYKILDELKILYVQKCKHFLEVPYTYMDNSVEMGQSANLVLFWFIKITFMESVPNLGVTLSSCLDVACIVCPCLARLLTWIF
jgi:hypothetical protein